MTVKRLQRVPQGTVDELFRALGHLVVQFASLEEDLHDAILLMSGADPDVVTILTSGLRFLQLVDRFEALGIKRRGSAVPEDDLHEFCTALRSVNEQRNSLIHSAWATYGESGVPRRFKRQLHRTKGAQIGITEVSPASVRELVVYMIALGAKLWEIVP